VCQLIDDLVDRCDICALPMEQGAETPGILCWCLARAASRFLSGVCRCLEQRAIAGAH
jgi:hypothetical protein